MKQRRGLFAVFILASVLALAGCSASGDEAAPSIASSTPNPDSRVATGTPKASPSSSSKPLNDLRTGRAKRVFKAGDLTVNVEYATPIRPWIAGAQKPLDVTVTAFLNGKREQKVYLSQVTAYPAAFDGSGPLATSDSLKDAAGISPGYLVTFPQTYNQSFLLPVVDEGATNIDIDLKYEFLLLQGSSSPRDYTKRTASETLTVPLSQTP
jgi:hypothetical protein